ncbi:AAA family ATPase [Breznakiellaceae bacterium SP9]
MIQRLPIGLQDFVKIREDGFLYLDKTAKIHELLTGAGGVFFLSRPRRFGKSLLCSTLGALFEGRRELFGDWRLIPSGTGKIPGNQN